MYKTTFHSTLRSARNAAKLSLKQLQKISGLEARRLTRLERGIALPADAEREALARVLTTHMFDLRRAPARPHRIYQKLKNRGSRSLQPRKPFFPPRDRESKVRMSAAMRRFPSEMSAIVRILKQRPNFDEINNLAENVALDSADECLYFSMLLAMRGEPAMLAPYAVSPRLRYDVVCPETREPVGFRPFPCVVREDGHYFPQVAFATPRLFVVDFLRHHEGCWSVVEIDGKGHDSANDVEKELALAMPVVRYSEEQLLRWVRGLLKEGFRKAG